MWNLIFEVLVYLFCLVCFFRLAKCYGNKFKEALASMKRTEKRDRRYNFSDYLDFRQCRLAAILYELAAYFSLYMVLTKLSHLIN